MRVNPEDFRRRNERGERVLQILSTVFAVGALLCVVWIWFALAAGFMGPCPG